MIVPAVAVGTDGETDAVYAWGTLRMEPHRCEAVFEDVPGGTRWLRVLFVAGGIDGTMHIDGVVKTKQGDRLRIFRTG